MMNDDVDIESTQEYGRFVQWCLGIAHLAAPPPPPAPKRYRVNPEEPVIDAIDALVRDQLRAGPNDDCYDKCEWCGHDWHGLQCADCSCRGR